MECNTFNPIESPGLHTVCFSPEETCEFDPSSINCAIKNVSFFSLIFWTTEKARFPYLLARCEKNITWFDAKALFAACKEGREIQNVAKVHLFALYGKKFVFLTKDDPKVLEELYLTPQNFEKHNENALFDAFRFYHDGSLEGFEGSKECFEKLKRRADDRTIEAFVLGRVFQNSEEKEMALSYYLKSAEKNYPKASLAAGKIFLKEAPAKAKKHLEIAQAANLLDDKTKLELAKLYRDEGQRSMAKTLFLQLAENGDGEAAYEYAELKNKKGKEKEACEWYRKAAAKNHPLAPYQAYLLLKKAGIKDVNVELGLLLQAARNHNPEAAHFAGVIYFEGQCEGGRDTDQAIALLNQAIKQGGNVESQYQLGLIYKDLNNEEQSLHYFTLAAQQKHQKAKEELAQLTLQEESLSARSASSSSTSARKSPFEMLMSPIRRSSRLAISEVDGKGNLIPPSNSSDSIN